MSEYFNAECICGETDRLCENTQARCKLVVLRAFLSTPDMIQKVFAINSVCFNLLTAPDGQSLLHKTTAPECTDYFNSFMCSHGESNILNKSSSAFHLTSPKHRCDSFKITVILRFFFFPSFLKMLLVRN